MLKIYIAVYPVCPWNARQRDSSFRANAAEGLDDLTARLEGFLHTCIKVAATLRAKSRSDKF
nr:hypothetical protein [uncultured Desulfobacter sp.]